MLEHLENECSCYDMICPMSINGCTFKVNFSSKNIGLELKKKHTNFKCACSFFYYTYFVVFVGEATKNVESYASP